jgi:hypothetical protein
MPSRKGYARVKGTTRTFMAPKPRKDASASEKHKLGVIYAGCRSSKKRSADTRDNKRYCAAVAHSKSGG